MESIQLDLLRLMAEMQTRLRGVQDARKAVIYGLRTTREAFGVREAAVAALPGGRGAAHLVHAMPRGSEWNTKLFSCYLKGTRPPIPSNTLLAPVKRRGRNWAVLALRDDGGRFTPEHRKGLFWITQTLTDAIQRVDRDRARTVRHKIERKISRRESAKDLMYDILHGLRTLTHYDHSASLFIPKEGNGPMELVAEQIAWTKAKSKRIGLCIDLDELTIQQLRQPHIPIYERVGGKWHHVRGNATATLPAILAYDSSPSRNVPRETSMLCAPIATPDGVPGILKISAKRRGLLGDHEAELVEEFMPLASLAIQFSFRTESLRARMLQSERKHVLANLARGIAHDVNNALGAMLPLVQQMRHDASAERLEMSGASEDLHYVEESIQTCRRIFGGMLSIARGSSRPIGQGNLRRAIENALSVLEDGMRRRSIEIDVDLPRELPTVTGGQGDLTQLILNICSNAKDAMPTGGTVQITARREDGGILVAIRDTGCGIPVGALPRVTEPFYTSKTHGNGLGLSICRSIVWDLGGEMQIESEEGRGTCVEISLPVLEEESTGVEE